MKAERRTLAEQLGSAVNASHLEHRSTHETAVDRVGGLGAAALHIHHRSDYRREPVAATVARPDHEVRPEDALTAELGSLLAHIRDGRQHGQVPLAVQTFAQWMGYRGRFAKFEDAVVLLPKLAARALHEFLSDRCPRCGGTGRLEVIGDGKLVRGTGRMARNAKFQACPQLGGCGGSGRPVPSHTQRRVALGLTPQRYDAEGWGANVQAALAWLSKLQARINRPLTVQLERSKKRC